MICETINQVKVDYLLENFDDLKFKSIKIGDDLFKVITNLSCSQLYQSSCNHGDDNQQIGLNSPSDLTPGIYEGGFKVWECSRDMIQFIQNDLQLTQSVNCLDLGCGSGIVGICLLQSTQITNVDFQDFNGNVLNNYTLPNIFANLSTKWATDLKLTWEQLSPRINLISGDWSDFPKSKVYDYIFSCETIYNQDNYSKLSDILTNCLSTCGCAYFAAKSYYFGVGGGVQEFQDFLEKEKKFTIEQVKVFHDCVERIIMKITHRKS